ncbi:class I SAM-dependent methyltransferase, partial [Bacteriovoracaceae bacterium]|nr:class I SAM-dependent methyltransferase [Bacteriovoracaceae bacterium]
IHHHRFDDANHWSKIFEDPTRDKWQKPNYVIKKLNIEKNFIIADIGSATGYFPIRLSKVVSQGRVWGIDVEPNLINYLNNRVKKEKITNLFSILGTFKDPLIPEPVDLVIMVNTYHHITNRIKYLKTITPHLKSGGRIAIIDFKAGDLPIGPKKEMKISKNKIIQEFKSANYKLSSEDVDLPYQFILIFKL